MDYNTLLHTVVTWTGLPALRNVPSSPILPVLPGPLWQLPAG